MIPDSCVKIVKHKKVLVEENNKKAIFLNAEESEFIVTRFDGCVPVCEGEKVADWVVSKPYVGDVIVELKGRDVHYATKQVIATAKYWCKHDLCNGQMGGLIVARQYPKESTSIQRAKNQFARDFKGPLHVVTKNSEYRLERVLRFSGPLGE